MIVYENIVVNLWKCFIEIIKRNFHQGLKWVEKENENRSFILKVKEKNSNV